MKFLISLKVKYGFPVAAVHGFLEAGDKEYWESFLSDYYYELCVSPEEGQIYLLIRNCMDAEKIRDGIENLPLIKEGFLEMQILQFGHFQKLDDFLGRKPYISSSRIVEV